MDAEQKNANGTGVLNPEDLEEAPMTVEDMKTLELGKYLINDLDIFEMLPIDRKQKVQFLNKLIKKSN